MTPHDVELVQTSFAKVTPMAEAAATLFYARLFETAPDIRPLFKGDMKEQGRKLMATLGVVVNGLRNLDAVLPAARALAVKHVAYGVKPQHYAPVGAALVWTLEQGLGPDFTPETKAAWLGAYDALSGTMIEAAEAAE